MNKPIKLPSVCIGMPVYNGEKTIKQSLESLLNQSYENLKVVISDNASTDGTEAICRELSRLHPNLEYHRNEQNLGVTNNYNKAFLLSECDYFKWASSNDLCDENYVERCVQVLEANPEVVLCFSKTSLFTNDITDAREYAEVLQGIDSDNPFERFNSFMNGLGLNNLMNGVIRSKVLKRTRLHEMHLQSDVNLMAELILYGKFYQIDEVMFYRSMDSETSTKLMTMDKVLEYWDPQGKENMGYQQWKVLLHYLRSVLKVPMDIGSKLKLVKLVTRMFYWKKSQLFGEIAGDNH